MTPETEAEIKASLAGIQRLLERMISTQEKQGEQVAEVRGDLKAVNARLDEQRAWLQSMDQRFTAIMAPYQQKPAA